MRNSRPRRSVRRHRGFVKRLRKRLSFVPMFGAALVEIDNSAE
jgi:hypothetical protein